MPGVVQVRLFGEVEVLGRRDGVPLKLALSRHARSLLAWLLLHRDAPSAREAVAFNLWSDESKDAALANLRRHLHLLSRKFCEMLPDDQVVLADKGMLSWNEGVPLDIDLDEFHRLHDTPAAGSRLIGIYRGELAADLEGDWLSSHRVRYREMFFTACVGSARTAFNLGKYHNALNLLEAALRHDPWREDIIRMAVLIRARSGDRAGALQGFEGFRETLARELGVAPSRALLTAVDSIRRDSVEDPFANETAHQDNDGRSETIRSPVEPKLGSYSFRGRQKELKALVTAFAGKGDSRIAAVAVAGDSGIGKTRLAEETSRIIAQGGVRTYWINCSARFRRPYGAILDLLNSPSARDRRQIEQNATAVLVERMTLGAHISTDPHLFVTSRSDVIAALVTAISESYEAANSLFVVDDAQWLDDASLDVLMAVKASPSVGARILVLYRTDCDEAGLHSKDLPRIADKMIELGPLAVADVEAIAWEQLQGGSTESAGLKSIAIASRGHPLFAKELALYTLSRNAGRPEELPSSITSSIRKRLTEFVAGELLVLQVSATLGVSFDIDLVSEVSQVSRSIIDVTVAKARDHYIIRQEAAALWRFSHDAFREALLETLSGDQRATLHAKVAAVLSREPVANELLSKLALHLWEADDRVNSAIFYKAAGDYARRMYAFHDALQFYERAATSAEEEGMRLQLLLSRAETYFELGLINETRRLLDALLERLDSAAEPHQELRCTALLRISACEWASLRRRAAAIWAGRALEEARGASCPGAYSEAIVTLARAAALRGDANEALGYLDELPSADVASELSAASYRALAYGMLGARSKGIAAVDERRLESAYEVVDAVTLASVLQNNGIVVGWFGDLQKARTYFDRAIIVAQRAMNKTIESVTLTARGYVELYAGDLRLARTYYDGAAALTDHAAGVAKIYSDAFGLRVAALTKDRTLAASLVHEQLFVMAELSDDLLFVNTLTGALIEYAATFGDLPRAQSLLKQYLGQLKVGCGLWYVFPSILTVADEPDLERAIELASGWESHGENEIGTAFSLALSSAMFYRRGNFKKSKRAATSAQKIFSTLALVPLSRAVETFANV